MGYLDEDKAIEKVKALAEEKKTECIEEMGYPEDAISVEGENNEDYRFVNAGENSYDYYITIVEVE